MTGSGYTCIRRTFCLANFLFWLIGCVLCSIGLWLKFNYELDYIRWQPKSQLFTIDQLLLTTATTTLLLSFSGCCGSWLQSRPLLILYFLILFLIVMLQCSMGVLAFTFREQIARNLRDELLDSLDKHRNTTVAVSADVHRDVPVWDYVQNNLKCCGINDHTDWYEIDGVREVPESCCRRNYPTCGQLPNQDNWHPDGCLSKLNAWITIRVHFVYLFVFSVIFFELCGLVTAMFLACTISDRKAFRKRLKQQQQQQQQQQQRHVL